jgi:YjbE family integral membrane protein
MGHVSGGFFFDLFSIVLIDLLLAGDNAIVIAMAVRRLPPEKRRIGIAAGAGGAVVIRIVLTYFAARILQVAFLKLLGGLFILWIAVKLLADAANEAGGFRQGVSMRHAIRLILVADVTMSVDNILAIAAASKGNLVLLIAGLGLSISFVIFASSLLSSIMSRYPVLIWIGAAILGRVAGDMMATDPWIVRTLHLSEPLQIGAQLFFALVVLAAGALARKKPQTAA